MAFKHFELIYEEINFTTPDRCSGINPPVREWTTQVVQCFGNGYHVYEPPQHPPTRLHPGQECRSSHHPGARRTSSKDLRLWEGRRLHLIYQVIDKPRNVHGHSDYAEKNGRDESRCYTGSAARSDKWGGSQRMYKHGVSIRRIEYSAFQWGC